jgi:acyl-CoA synthetase (AMP-forming)/AMP-acid ligase II
MGALNFNRLLRRSAQLYAGEPAIADLATGHRATYAEHLARVERLCAVVGQLGVGPRDRFAVLAGGSHVYVELWHAALAGAGIINPLNSRLAPDELAYILEDSGTEVIFVDATSAPGIAALRERLPGLRAVVLVGEGDAPVDHRLDALLAAAEAPGLPAEPGDDDPAVLMYTGGTTGRPKGVVLTQRAIVLTIYRMLIEFRFPARATYLAFMPLFHIGGIASWGLVVPGGGRTLVLPAFEPGAVNAAIRDHGATVIGSVPTMLAMMLQHPGYDAPMLSSLELVMYGAAPMPPELADTLLARYPGLGFVQAYGMTECASTVTMLNAADHQRGGPILRSVGRAGIDVEIAIRHPETGTAVDDGEVGEIWIRCGSVMEGYWNKPAETAAVLVDGWYRSGDAGRLDPEGYLFLADRVKDMIVTGGENVYSLEVENAISSHPGVRQVAVVGVPDPVWGEAVHAVVVCEPGSVSAEELAAHARAQIAGYKVPKGWTFQTEPLPLSAAAKVLKRELRAQVAARLDP